jgi:hypothetical protein
VNIITPEIETEAALYAEGTKYSKADIIAEYRAHVRRAAEDGVEHLDIQRFCEGVLRISGPTPESILPSLTGLHLRDPAAAAAIDRVDFTGYYPVIDADLILTGQFVYADQPGGWSNYCDDAAIYNDVARRADWTIEDGYAHPDPISLSAETLCRLSGLSLEDWGLDEDASVIVFPDRINATTASGLGIPDIASGNDALERKVWQAAVEWLNGGDQ